jgi:hypothetical protein
LWAAGKCLGTCAGPAVAESFPTSIWRTFIGVRPRHSQRAAELHKRWGRRRTSEPWPTSGTSYVSILSAGESRKGNVGGLHPDRLPYGPYVISFL